MAASNRFDPRRMRMAVLLASVLGLALWGIHPLSSAAQSVTASEEEVTFYTEEWSGERYASGRPKVSDDVLERMERVSIEEAWSVLRQHDYHNQFAGNWKMIHPDQPIVGRALTAQYMPSSPGFEERLTERGRQNGHEGPPNTWPIEMLQQGDVYVADGYGKIKDGTLIGGNLGTDIYANSGNGVVFDGSLRDLGQLEAIEEFNAFVRGWHPSFIQEMMLTGINEPIRIGEATVLPGDVVLAKREGVIFIPAHLAEEVVRQAEITTLRDRFGQQRMREGTYTSGQIDSQWSDAIIQDFYRWLKQNKNDLPVSPERVQEIIETKPL